MKYVDGDGKVGTLTDERHPFKRVVLLIPSFIRILLTPMRIYTQKNSTLVTKQIRSQKKTNVSGK